MTDSPTQKFVSKEYHEGQNAYARGDDPAANPYVHADTFGSMYWWNTGYMAAMSGEIHMIRQFLIGTQQTQETVH